MALEVMTTTAAAAGGGRGGDPVGTLILVGGAGAAAYFGYRWWQREQVKAALLAEAERLKAAGMSTRDALTNAAAGGCVAAAAAYKIPPAQAGPMCQGAAIVAIKAAELVGKGAIIAGKAIGKGTVTAGKAVGHATVATGKAIGKGTKAVVYTAPKKVIGGTVNTADRLLTKAVTLAVPKPIARVVSKVVPKPVKQVAAVTKKVAKKALCLGIFCGLEGADGYEAALSGATSPRPLGRRRRSPILVPASVPRLRAPVRSRPRPASAAGQGGAAYYAGLLR